MEAVEAIDIGVPDDYARAPRRARFLDRDGVINIDRGYVCAQEQFEFVEGIFDLCRYATELGYLIIVVSNQAGIGRGYYGEGQNS